MTKKLLLSSLAERYIGNALIIIVSHTPSSDASALHTSPLQNARAVVGRLWSSSKGGAARGGGGSRDDDGDDGDEPQGGGGGGEDDDAGDPAAEVCAEG